MLYKSRLRECRANEITEERVRGKRFRLQFGVKLCADIPGMVWNLDDLGQAAVGAHPREAQTAVFEPVLVFDIDFVTVAMPFRNGLGLRKFRQLDCLFAKVAS